MELPNRERLCPFMSGSNSTGFGKVLCREMGCMAWGYVNNEKDIEGCKLIERQILTVQIK